MHIFCLKVFTFYKCISKMTMFSVHWWTDATDRQTDRLTEWHAWMCNCFWSQCGMSTSYSKDYMWLYLYLWVKFSVYVCVTVNVCSWSSSEDQDIQYEIFNTWLPGICVIYIYIPSWNFSMLLLYILWDHWPIFMISDSNEELHQQLKYTILKSDYHSWWISKM